MMDGKVHWITGNTQQERYEKAIQLFLGSSAHVPEKKKGPLFRPYAEKWFQVFRKGKIRHTTEAEYCSILQKHIYPALGQKELASITAADIQLLIRMCKRSIRKKPEQLWTPFSGQNVVKNRSIPMRRKPRKYKAFRAFEKGEF